MRPLLLLLALACLSPKRQGRADARYQLGSAYLEEGNPEGAIVELREATQLDRRNWGAWEKLALAYMARGALDESQEAFERALKLQPENAQVLNNYGLLLMRQGRLGPAIDAFEKATRDLTYRKPALVLNNLGYAYFLDGQHDLALLKLDEAVERSPTLCQARFHRGLVWQAKGNLDRSLTDLDAVIQACGEEAPGAYYHAAEVLLAQGNRDAAEVYLQNVLRLASDDPRLTDAARALLAQAD